MPRRQGYNFYKPRAAISQYHELNILSQPTSWYAMHNATQVSDLIYVIINKPLQYVFYAKLTYYPTLPPIYPYHKPVTNVNPNHNFGLGP